MGAWSRFERRWLRVILEAMFPSGVSERAPLGAADIPLDAYFDDLERQLTPRVHLGVRAAIWFLWWIPVFFGHWRPFGALNEEGREAVLERLREHPNYYFRELALLLKTVGSFGVLGTPEAQRMIGHPRPDATQPSWRRAASAQAAAPRAALGDQGVAIMARGGEPRGRVA